MAVTDQTTLDVAPVLAEILAEVAGVRVEWYASDKARPPVAVVGLPVIDWADPGAGFCWATWEFPILVVTARNSDKEAQIELGRLVRDCAIALERADLAGTGLFSVTLMDARPTVATLGGQDLPAYNMRVQVRA